MKVNPCGANLKLTIRSPPRAPGISANFGQKFKRNGFNLQSIVGVGVCPHRIRRIWPDPFRQGRSFHVFLLLVGVDAGLTQMLLWRRPSLPRSFAGVSFSSDFRGTENLGGVGNLPA